LSILFGWKRTFGDTACNPEPIRFAQGKRSEGPGARGAEILRFAQDDIRGGAEILRFAQDDIRGLHTDP